MQFNSASSKDTEKMTTRPASNTHFSVAVQPSGRTFTVPQGEAILAAGIGQGIGLPYGCKDGACGSCKCKLLTGSALSRVQEPVSGGAAQDRGQGKHGSVTQATGAEPR